jgi:hypothetical protein
MKKLELNLNYSEIKTRIEADKAQYKVKKWAELVGSSIATISNIHGKKGKVKPSIEYIVAVSRATGKPVEWYLYGEEKNGQRVKEAPCEYNPDRDPMHEWPPEVKKACHQLKNILLSNHPVIKPALLSNLAAFEHSIEKEKEQDEKIKKVSKRVRELENAMKRGQPTGTDEAASSSTGKPET